MAYDCVVPSLSTVANHLEAALDFFEELPDVLEGFFFSFFAHIKGV
jgi:hypothetical protein